MPVTRIERPFGSSTLVLETGKLAKQAHGSVVVQLGETLVLTAATSGGAIPGRDFFPLQVEYRERTYAAGKFPGGFIKRETRMSTKETLVSRFIDRPIRPLFPVGYLNEVQVMATVMASDKEKRSGHPRHHRRQRRPASVADPIHETDWRCPRWSHR